MGRWSLFFCSKSK